MQHSGIFSFRGGLLFVVFVVVVVGSLSVRWCFVMDGEAGE